MLTGIQCVLKFNHFGEYEHIVDLRVTWVCIHDLTWHQNDLKVD